MKIWFVLGAVVVALCLISLLRIGVWLKYSEGGLFVRAKVAGLSFQAYPLPPKKPKKAKKTTSQPATPTKPKPKLDKKNTVALVKELIPMVAQAAGKLKRAIQLDRFFLDLLWGLEDPAACAVGYGAANAFVGMIWPLVEQNFHVKEHRIRTAVDFDRATPALWLETQATLRLGQAVALGLWCGIQFLQATRRVRPVGVKTKEKEAV